MSEKMTCPGCDSHTSSVLRAYEDGQDCPLCGLSYQAADEILTLRDKKANADLKSRVTQLLKEKSKAEEQARLWERKYRLLKSDLETGIHAAESITVDSLRDYWR